MTRININAHIHASYPCTFHFDSVYTHLNGSVGEGSLYSTELRNKRKSHSKYFVVYSLYNILIYIPHLVENTITMAPVLGAIFKSVGYVQRYSL